MTANRTKVLVECGLMIALATALSYVPIFEMPMGGSITLCSMMPLMVVSFRHGAGWGVFTGTVHGIIQMLLGLKNVFYCTTLLSMIGCILLDYVVAYAVMGLSCVFAKPIAHRSAAVAVGTVAAGLLRYGCSFLSGILIWGAYTPEGMSVWRYSLVYNGSFMIPEILITAVSSVLVMRIIENRRIA